MKRAATILMLAVAMLIGGMSADAKTTKKKAKAKSTATAVGKFTRYGDTINLLSNGKAQSQDRCLTGKYSKEAGGAYYKVLMSSAPGPACGDGDYSFLIVGDNVYEISAGSECVITNFYYDLSNNIITITEVDGGPVTEDELEYLEMTTPNASLSEFTKLGTIKWTR